MFARMRLTATLLSVLLVACATPAPAPTQAPTEQPRSASQATQLFASAGRADAPRQSDIERALGAPDIARRDGAGAAWTYRLDTCALLLLFAADARNEMRLTETHVSARQAGAAAPTLEQCAAEADARR